MSKHIQESSHLELKKHVGLIHSTNHLSLLERKIANALLFNAYDELKTEQEHEIHLETLSRLIGYNSKDFKTLKKSLKSLISTIIEWNILEKDKDDVWVACSMLADAKIEGPLCTYSYSPRMRELCYFPEFYARLDLKTISAFKSTYGIALYENCVRYRNIKHTPWMPMTIYRKLMGVCEEKYKDFKSLKRRVITPSVAEVNNYSQIYVEPEFKKRGRAVSEVRFLIRGNIKKRLSTNDTFDAEVANTFGISILKVQELIKIYGKSYLNEKATLITTSKSYIEGNIQNLSRYLISSLEKDYQPAKSSSDNRVKIRKQKEQDETDRKNLIVKKERYINYLCKHVNDILENVSPEKNNEIIKGFESSIKNSVYDRLYKKEGISGILIEEKFIRFMLMAFKEQINNFYSFEEYLKKELMES